MRWRTAKLFSSGMLIFKYISVLVTISEKTQIPKKHIISPIKRPVIVTGK
jgi:hypothetical protein